jgi:hypothetical protein
VFFVCQYSFSLLVLCAQPGPEQDAFIASQGWEQFTSADGVKVWRELPQHDRLFLDYFLLQQPRTNERLGSVSSFGLVVSSRDVCVFCVLQSLRCAQNTNNKFSTAPQSEKISLQGLRAICCSATLLLIADMTAI